MVFFAQWTYNCRDNEIGHLSYCVEYMLDEQFLVFSFRTVGLINTENSLIRER